MGYENKLQFAFLGSTNYSKEMLLFLIENEFIPKVIFYISKKFKWAENRRLFIWSLLNFEEWCEIYG